MRRLRAKLPANVLLVLDAAYAEYVRRNDYEAGIELVATTNNTVMTRTFSKIYGLAALRIGWAYCPAAMADVLNRIRGPFNVSNAAIRRAPRRWRIRRTSSRRRRTTRRGCRGSRRSIEKLGLKVTPSVANFLLIHFPKEQEPRRGAADEFLKSRAHHPAPRGELSVARLPAHDHRVG